MGGSASPLPALAGWLGSLSAAEETKPPLALSRVLGGRAPKAARRWRGREAGSHPPAFEPRAVVSVPGRSREQRQLTRHGGAGRWHPAAPALQRQERRTLQKGKSAPLSDPLSLAHPRRLRLSSCPFAPSYPASLAPRSRCEEGRGPTQPRAAPRWPRGDGPGE